MLIGSYLLSLGLATLAGVVLACGALKYLLEGFQLARVLYRA
jgi:hypothetical protein